MLDDDEIESQYADLFKVNEIQDADGHRHSKQCFRRHEKLPFSPTDFKLSSKFGIPEESVSDILERARKLLDEPGNITKAASSDEYMRTVRSSYGAIPHLVTPSSRNRYLLTCPCKTYNMFDLCHHALAASADIGIVMEYLMEVVKKFEQKKQKKLSSYSITNAYKPTLTVNQLGKKKNEFNKPNSKRLKKNDDFFMKTAASAGRIEKNYNTQTPSSNCSEYSAEISFSGHSLSGNQGSSTFSQNSATNICQILGYQTSFEGNKTSNTPFVISFQSHSLTSPNSTHILQSIQSCHLSENSFAQTF